jgi:hypothetical protein
MTWHVRVIGKKSHPLFKLSLWKSHPLFKLSLWRLSPPILTSFNGIYKVRKFLLNLAPKSWKSALNAEGLRVTIVFPPIWWKYYSGSKLLMFCKIFIPIYSFDALLCQNWPFSPPLLQDINSIVANYVCGFFIPFNVKCVWYIHTIVLMLAMAPPFQNPMNYQWL